MDFCNNDCPVIDNDVVGPTIDVQCISHRVTWDAGECALSCKDERVNITAKYKILICNKKEGTWKTVDGEKVTMDDLMFPDPELCPDPDLTTQGQSTTTTFTAGSTTTISPDGSTTTTTADGSTTTTTADGSTTTISPDGSTTTTTTANGSKTTTTATTIIITSYLGRPVHSRTPGDLT